MKIGRVIFTALALAASPVTTLAQNADDGLMAYYLEDYAKALEILNPLAESGSAEAQAILAQMYEMGRGVPQDFGQALRLHRLAANQGHHGAQINLGWLFALGDGVTQDFVTAHMWWSIASSNGSELGRRNRDLLAISMTPEQIAKAQQRARAQVCIDANYKNCDE